MNRFGVLLLLLSTLGVDGCWVPLRRHTRQIVPAPPVVTPNPAPETKPETKPADKPAAQPEAPPEIKPESPPMQLPPELSQQPPVAKPPSKKPSRKQAQSVIPPAPAPAPAATPPAPAPAASSVPQLGVLLTAEQRNQYEADYASNLALAQDGLVRTAGAALNSAQRESVTRIRSFMRQAEELHKKDLATAAQLAHHAAVLSQDLAQSMR